MPTAAQLSENSHQGSDGLKAALYLGSMEDKSNTASGMPVCLWREGTGSRSSGKERDAETGLDYFLARYYSGAQGRFLSPDEFKGGPDDALTGRDITPPGPLPYADISNPQSLNKYTYVLNNPLKYTDPDGHFWDTVLDIVGVGYDIYDLVTAPSWSKAGTLGLDVVLAAVPVLPTVGGVKAGANLLGKADDAIDAAKAVEKGVDAEKTATTVREAQREAMRMEGIPTSMQPTSQKSTVGGRQYTYDVPKPGGGTEQKIVTRQHGERSHPGQTHVEAGSPKRAGQTDPLGRRRHQNEKKKVIVGKEDIND